MTEPGPMEPQAEDPKARSRLTAKHGPWLVALGAALWGTESAWRIPLKDVLDVNVLVFWEHAILATLALPWVLPRLGELRRVRMTTLAWLLFSGIAGSAIGAVLFTHALASGNPTVVNIVLNLQPLVSTTAAVLLLGDRVGPKFLAWAGVAMVAGIVLVGVHSGFQLGVDAGVGYALACALAWGLSTVAGRAVMVEMSLPLAAGLRVIIGFACMAVIVATTGLWNWDALWPDVAAENSLKVVWWLVLLTTVSGGIPLLVYFRGLSLTRASIAGYFEMMQTLVAVVITWGFFHQALSLVQVIAGVVLIGAVAMVQRVQAPMV
jgi:drug/metabolite transporter (DMT)-like permease